MHWKIKRRLNKGNSCYHSLHGLLCSRLWVSEALTLRMTFVPNTKAVTEDWRKLRNKENLAPAGIRSPDRPVRSESLHRLRYPGSASARILYEINWFVF
jgi:hypothetical protein